MLGVIGFLTIIASILGGLYLGGWRMFIQPIIEACRAFDAGTLTGMIVGTTVLKCFFAGTIGYLIAYIGCWFGTWLIYKE